MFDGIFCEPSFVGNSMEIGIRIDACTDDEYCMYETDIGGAAGSRN